MSYTDSCSMPIKIYCWGDFVVVYSKQHCYKRKKYDCTCGYGYVHSYKIAWLYLFRFLSYAGWRRRRTWWWTKLPIIAPYIYDARYNAHPYILPYLVMYTKGFVHITLTNFDLYTDTCVPIIMLCLRLFTVVERKETNKSLWVTEIYFLTKLLYYIVYFWVMGVE